MNGQIHLNDIQSAISRFHDETAGYINSQGNEPATNSQTAREIAACNREESYRTAIMQGGMTMETASDHLVAFNRAITEPLLSISPWTCSRAVIESSALSTWLLDISVDESERISRSLAFRHEGMLQQRRWANAMGQDPTPVDQRIDQIEQMALTIGYQRVLDRNGNRIGIGQIMPTMTQLVTNMLNEEATYRLLSSVVHAHPWSLNQISFQQSIDQGSSSQSSVFSQNTVLMERHISLDSIVFLLLRISTSFAHPLFNKSQLYGWDIDALRHILNAHFDRMRTTNDIRFWN